MLIVRQVPKGMYLMRLFNGCVNIAVFISDNVISGYI